MVNRRNVEQDLEFPIKISGANTAKGRKDVFGIEKFVFCYWANYSGELRF